MEYRNKSNVSHVSEIIDGGWREVSNERITTR